MGASLDVAASKKEAEEAHQAVNSTYLPSYMLKPPPFITHYFKYNKEVKGGIFKNMCSFGAWVE